TKRYASASRRPLGSDVGWRRTPDDRRRSTFRRGSSLKSSRTVPLPKTNQPPPRIQIQHVEPLVDCGRYPIKRIVGERVDVYASIFKDGHDVLGACVQLKPPGASRWREEPLRPLGNDRWSGSFVVDAPGRWSWRVDAWTDRVATWREEVRRKHEAAQEDLSSELAEG